MPGCAYNAFYRHKAPRFNGAAESGTIWGKDHE